jgi:RecB family exonuclease
MEEQVRRAIVISRSGGPDAAHPAQRAISLLRARRGDRFTEWDGNLSSLGDASWLDLQRAVSPTSLENYAACGFRYFCRSLLRLNVIDEPEEREMMDPAARGSLIHSVLDRFFKEASEQGRPAVAEPWTPNDRRRLLDIADEEMEAAKARGQTGLDLYRRHEARTIRTDLDQFLVEDELFRMETGAIPAKFEEAIPDSVVAGVRLRGRVDRVDITPDAKAAWVIDYKTGSARDFKDAKDDPLLGGRKLQLPVYLAAVPEIPKARAIYWFITRKGEFRRDVVYEATPENESRFRRTLEAIVHGIRAGAFPAVSGEENEFWGAFDNCSYCDFGRICSRRRDQEFALKAGDEAMEPWSAVAVAAAPQGKSD